MMTTQKLLHSSWLKICLIGLCTSLVPFGAYGDTAPTIDAEIGYFNLAAKTSNSTANISNFGLLFITYKHHLKDNLKLAVGYSMYTLGTNGGDMGYGFDLGSDYYPIGESEPVAVNTNRVRWNASHQWRPFIGARFHQRQYQSVQSSYFGFGFLGGAELSWKQGLRLRTTARAMVLNGPYSSSITEWSLSGGLSYDM